MVRLDLQIQNQMYKQGKDLYAHSFNSSYSKNIYSNDTKHLAFYIFLIESLGHCSVPDI